MTLTLETGSPQGIQNLLQEVGQGGTQGSGRIMTFGKLEISFFKKHFIGVQLLYYVVLVSAVQQSESAMGAWVLSRSVVSDSFQPRGLQPARLLCPWDFPRQEYCSGLPFPLKGIFLTQEWNLRLQRSYTHTYTLSFLDFLPIQVTTEHRVVLQLSVICRRNGWRGWRGVQRAQLIRSNSKTDGAVGTKCSEVSAATRSVVSGSGHWMKHNELRLLGMRTEAVLESAEFSIESVGKSYSKSLQVPMLAILGEYNCFTILCQSLLYNEVKQLCVYIYPLPLGPPLHPSMSSWSTELSSLCYTAAFH